MDATTNRSVVAPLKYLTLTYSKLTQAVNLGCNGYNELKDIINLLKGFYGISSVLYIMIFESLFSPSQTCPASQVQTG